MIVKCERCQTRFKIPDEKVTDKGVKVRCTKCQHTFRVAREDLVSAAPTPGGPPVPSVEPAAKPPATPRAGTPFEAPRPVAAKPAVPGVASPRGVPASTPTSVPRDLSPDSPKTPGTLDLDPLMEFIGENTPTPAESLRIAAMAQLPNKPAGALALGPQAKAPAGAKPAAGAPRPLSFDESNPFAEAPKPAAPVPAPKPVPARTAPAVAAPKPAAPAPKPAAPTPVPARSPAPVPQSSAPLTFDESDPFEAPPPAPKPAPAPRPVPVQVPARSAAPAPKPAPAPAPVPAPSAPVGFDVDDPFSLPPEEALTVPATPTLPPRGAAPAPSRASEPVGFDADDPFSLPPDDAPTVPATPTLPPAPASSAPVYEEMEGLEGNNPFVTFDPVAALPPAPAPAPAARSAAPAPAPVPVPVPAAEEMEGLEGNNPFATFDPVAALPPAARNAAPAPSPAPSAIPDWGAPQQAAPSAIPDWGAPRQAAPSGVPDWGAPQQAPPSGIPDWGAPQTVAATPIAKADAQTERNPFPLPDFPGPGEAPPSREILPDLPPMSPAPAPPVLATPDEPAKKKEKDPSAGPSLVQRLAGMAAQFVVAAVLVVGLLALGSAWLNDGRVELSSLSPSKMREMVSPTLPLMGKDLSNGLYETFDGHTLFFVRGEVENRGTAPVRVKASVALFEGDQKVKSAEGLVGEVPTPEQLFTLKNAAAADALRTRLDAAAKEVAPGARAPFVVFFYDHPSDMGSFRLEVTFESQAQVAGNAQP